MNYPTPIKTYQNGYHPESMSADHTDILTVIGKDNVPRDFPLDGDALSLGRATDNDVVLNDYAISRYHLRVERDEDGWRVIDLNSTNGALVAGKRLLPNEPLPWDKAQAMVAGPFEIRWRRFEHQDLHQATIVMNLPTLAEREASTSRAASNANEYVEIGVQLDQDELMPGDSAIVELTLLNLGVTADDFMLEVDGIPSEWVRMSQSVVRLEPTEIQKSHFTITIPHNGMAVRGNYEVRVHLRSTQTMRAAAVDKASFSIQGRHDFQMDVRQMVHNSAVLCDVMLKNEGNSADFYTMHVNSNSPRLRFNANQWKLALTPHTGDQVRVLITPQKRKLFGEPDHIPYSVNVMAESGQQKNFDGYVEVRPVLDWQKLLLSLLIIAGIAGLVWLILFLVTS